MSMISAAFGMAATIGASSASQRRPNVRAAKLDSGGYVLNIQHVLEI
jgi:hypothetical protein